MADVAVTLAAYEGFGGEAMASGERLNRARPAIIRLRRSRRAARSIRTSNAGNHPTAKLAPRPLPRPRQGIPLFNANGFTLDPLFRIMASCSG